MFLNASYFSSVINPMSLYLALVKINFQTPGYIFFSQTKGLRFVSDNSAVGRELHLSSPQGFH